MNTNTYFPLRFCQNLTCAHSFALRANSWSGKARACHQMTCRWRMRWLYCRFENTSGFLWFVKLFGEQQNTAYSHKKKNGYYYQCDAYFYIMIFILWEEYTVQLKTLHVLYTNTHSTKRRFSCFRSVQIPKVFSATKYWNTGRQEIWEIFITYFKIRRWNCLKALKYF